MSGIALLFDHSGNSVIVIAHQHLGIELRDDLDENVQDLDLQMTVKFVDGDEIIADSSKAGLLGACREFEAFVAARTAAK